VGGRKGWRLPSFHELASLLDPNNSSGDPDLPLGHPFDGGFLNGSYWSATTWINISNAADIGNAWFVNFVTRAVDFGAKNNTLTIVCVRGGSPGPDAY
jgi:hypothetical protein